ncbi:MAG: metallopeptidase family protein [Pseudomonadota bacterium]
MTVPTLPPSLDDVAALAAKALAALPEPFAAHAARLVIRVADFADAETLASLEIEDPFELTGLYSGTALTEKSQDQVSALPDEVWLYRRAILDEWVERGDVALDALVTHVLVHEIAHHFGWSDDDIAAVDDWRL